MHNVPAVSQCGRQNHHSSTPPTAISSAYFPLLDSSSVVDAQTHESFLAFGGRAQAFGADDDGSGRLSLGKRPGKGRKIALFLNLQSTIFAGRDPAVPAGR